MAFIKHSTNPNAPVGGGCLGTNGVKGFDCKPPFYEATGVVCVNATCPKPVICTHCLGELLRAAEGEAIPVGYGQVEKPATVVEKPILDEPAPKPRAKKSKPAEDLSL